MLWWLAQNFFIAAALAVVVALVCRFRRLNPVARHALWLLVLIKLVTPPLGAWPWALRDPLGLERQDALQRSQVSVVKSAPADMQYEIVVGSASGSAAISSAPQAVVRNSTKGTAALDLPRSSLAAVEAVKANWPLIAERAVLWVWALGSLSFVLLQVVRILNMMYRLRGAKLAGGELAAQVRSLSEQLCMRSVRVRVVEDISSPAIWAVLRPQLLWPAELPADLSQRALHGLLVHELAHAKRRDHWVGWLELIAGCLWWWNPLYWYVRHEVRENAELACDAWVVQTIPKGRRAYAEALLAVCESLNGRAIPAPSVGAQTGGRQFLERRLAMILRERFALRLGWFQVAAVMLLGVMAAPAWSQRATDKYEEKYRAELKDRELETAEVQARYRAVRQLQEGRLDLSREGEEATPNAAAAIMAEFERQKALARIDMEERIEKQRQETLARLRDLAAKLDQVGNVHEAQAVRDYMKKLEPAQVAAADPGTLVNYRDRVGQTFVFQVTGQEGGTIWGSEVYTDDSPLGVTAVHAGILKVGETGLVRVHILPGRESYQGETKNGIASNPYGVWYGSYTISSARRNMVMLKPRGDEAQWQGGRGVESAAKMPKGPVLDYRRATGKTDPTLWDVEVEAVPPANGAAPGQP